MLSNCSNKGLAHVWVAYDCNCKLCANMSAALLSTSQRAATHKTRG